MCKKIDCIIGSGRGYECTFLRQYGTVLQMCSCATRCIAASLSRCASRPSREHQRQLLNQVRFLRFLILLSVIRYLRFASLCMHFNNTTVLALYSPYRRRIQRVSRTFATKCLLCYRAVATDRDTQRTESWDRCRTAYRLLERGDNLAGDAQLLVSLESVVKEIATFLTIIEYPLVNAPELTLIPIQSSRERSILQLQLQLTLHSL